MKSSMPEDVVCEETDPGNIVYADGTETADEFPVFQQGDLTLHFVDGLFDGHLFLFRYEGVK